MSGVRVPVYHAGTGAEIDEQAVVDKSFVPHIIRLTLRSGAEYPDIRHVVNGHERVEPLHHVVYDLSPAARKRPRRAGWEVHHRNKRPFDNRQSNLRLHTAADHKRLTLDEKQKVTRRK